MKEVYCTFYFNYDLDIKNWAEFFFNAHAAVVAFYVLSGYVLTLSLLKKEVSISNIKNFYIKRVFRIYPALWVACLISLAYLVIFKDVSKSNLVSQWWDDSYRDEYISWEKVFVNFLGFGTELPIPTWSISLELIASIFLPFLVILVKKSKSLLLFITIILGYFSITGTGILKVYMFYFALGATIFNWQLYIEKIKSEIISILSIICIFLIFFGRQIGGWNYDDFYHNPWAALIEGLSSAILIAIIVTHSQRINILKNKSLIYLGDISYSVYLLHLPIMGFLGYFIEKFSYKLNLSSNTILLTILLTLSTFIITVIISKIIYEKIEKPGIEIGSIITK